MPKTALYAEPRAHLPDLLDGETDEIATVATIVWVNPTTRGLISTGRFFYRIIPPGL